MTIGDSILLGILQGITEFLPVSSSGHLAVAQQIMNVSQPGVNFEIALHLGTLLSIFVVLGKDIRDVLVSLKSKQTQRLILFVIIGTVPAAIIGLLMKSEISAASEYLPMVGVGFLVSALFLFMMRFASNINVKMNITKTIIIGFAQAAALFAGISRSGMTISSARLMGIHAKEAFRFSFFLAIPAILGSGILLLRDLSTEAAADGNILVMFVGAVAAFVVGIGALLILRRFLMSGKLHWLGFYCLAMGIISLLI
jgi:undecaprenyl-diphosphatase